MTSTAFNAIKNGNTRAISITSLNDNTTIASGTVSANYIKGKNTGGDFVYNGTTISYYPDSTLVSNLQQSDEPTELFFEF